MKEKPYNIVSISEEAERQFEEHYREALEKWLLETSPVESTKQMKATQFTLEHTASADRVDVRLHPADIDEYPIEIYDHGNKTSVYLTQDQFEEMCDNKDQVLSNLKSMSE